MRTGPLYHPPMQPRPDPAPAPGSGSAPASSPSPAPRTSGASRHPEALSHSAPDGEGTVEACLVEVLRASAPAFSGDIRPDHLLVEDLGFDSIALVRTIVALEEAFGVELPPERLHELRAARVRDVALLLRAAGAQA